MKGSRAATSFLASKGTKFLIALPLVLAAFALLLQVRCSPPFACRTNKAGVPRGAWTALPGGACKQDVLRERSVALCSGFSCPGSTLSAIGSAE